MTRTYTDLRSPEYLARRVAAGDARIAELESLCAEKDANIAELIELLQKAEAQNAQSAKPEDGRE